MKNGNLNNVPESESREITRIISQQNRRKIVNRNSNFPSTSPKLFRKTKNTSQTALTEHTIVFAILCWVVTAQISN